MRFSIADLPEGAEISMSGDLATITLGALVFRSQATTDELVLFPDRSVKQRDFLKLMGRLVE